MTWSKELSLKPRSKLPGFDLLPPTLLALPPRTRLIHPQLIPCLPATPLRHTQQILILSTMKTAAAFIALLASTSAFMAPAPRMRSRGVARMVSVCFASGVCIVCFLSPSWERSINAAAGVHRHLAAQWQCRGGAGSWRCGFPYELWPPKPVSNSPPLFPFFLFAQAVNDMIGSDVETGTSLAPIIECIEYIARSTHVAVVFPTTQTTHSRTHPPTRFNRRLV